MSLDKDVGYLVESIRNRKTSSGRIDRVAFISDSYPFLCLKKSGNLFTIISSSSNIIWRWSAVKK